VTAGLGGLGYYMYLYNELVEKPLSVYPPPVAKQIKQALYYASQNDAAKMAACFKRAITEAEEAGIHPLSDKIAGLKIECAALLGKLNDGEHKEKAVEILERVLDESVAGAEYFTEEKRWKDRSQVLQRAVLLGYKVGEMYTELKKNKEAEEAMVWSTETLLREIHRRERDKATVEEQGEWFDRVAVSACLESKIRGPWCLGIH
jgi:tetratricopeptide (TPR) repeat protein